MPMTLTKLRNNSVLLPQDGGLLMRRALWAGAYVGRRPGEQQSSTAVNPCSATGMEMMSKRYRFN
jgi:hypothetical protein